MRILKFYTERCWPCKIYGPILDKFCKEKNITLISLNPEFDDCRDYDITSVPTTVIENERWMVKYLWAMWLYFKSLNL